MITGVPQRVGRRGFRRPNRLLGTVCGASLVLSGLALVTDSALAGTPTISNWADASNVTEQVTTTLDSDVTFTAGSAYGGGYLEFGVGSATSTDVLGVTRVATRVATNGVVSIEGNSVYLGNGTIAEPIGSIDSTLDGSAGKKLRVNFVSEFSNSSFEDGITGWTYMDQQIILGSTVIAGRVSQDYAVYPGNCSITNDDTVTGIGSGAFSYELIGTGTSPYPTHGSKALRLISEISSVSGHVIHGPAIFSGEFPASNGDVIYFDWAAANGGDDYHVYGYLLNTETGRQIELLDANGGVSSWRTKPTTIDQTGNYRFVFVSGTNDASCGGVSGASLYIDNVRVFGSKVNDAVASNVARLVTYTNTSDNPPASRTITVTARAADAGIASANKTVNITPVDDPVSLATPTGPSYTNTSADDSFSVASGTLSAADPDGDAISFGISGGVVAPVTVSGVTYDTSLAGTFGTLRVATNGLWRYEPDDATLDPQSVATTDVFTVSANAAGVESTATFTVTINVPASAPSAPTNPSASPSGAGAITVSNWGAPWWQGGSAIADYLVRYRVAGASSWTTFNDAFSPNPSVIVTGLVKNTDYEFQVAAANATGTSAYSTTTSATTFDTPTAPSLGAITTTVTTMEIGFTGPSSDGGMTVTDYRYSLNGGSTWSLVGSTSSPITVTGLDPGRVYDVQLLAVNPVGDGWASASVRAEMQLPAPTAVTATPDGVGSIQVDWAASAIAAGPAIDHYTVQYRDLPNGSFLTFATTSATSLDVTGLANATGYEFRVSALNVEGVDSEWSVPVEKSTWATPTSPTITGIVTTDTQLTITYTVPASDGGTPLTAIEYSLDGGATWIDSGGLATTISVGSLAPGAVYDVTVRALNVVGSGVAATVTSSAMVLPEPTSLTAAPDGGDSIGLAWSAPATPGGPSVVEFDVERRRVGSADPWVLVATFPTTSGSVNGLAPATTYEFRIRARNAMAVVSPNSATISATTHALPDAPTITSVVAGPGTIEIIAGSPANTGGMPLTGYQYSTDLGANWTTPDDPLLVAPHTITGLAPGALYEVWLRAVTAVGSGATTSATVTTRTLPLPPPPPFVIIDTDTDDDPSSGVPNGDMPQPGGVVEAGSGNRPTLVDDSTADEVRVPAGNAKVLVNGRPVGAELVLVLPELAQIPPERRNPEQVAELRQQADDMLTAFVDRLPDGATSIVRVEETATGALIHGLVVDPDTGKSVGIPVENVVMLVSPDSVLMLTAASTDTTVGSVINGVITVQPGGEVSVVANGLQPGVDGEVVLFSTPQLIARFATDDHGTFQGNFVLPTGVVVGDHSLVFVAPGTSASVGISVAPPNSENIPDRLAGRLPVTGQDTSTTSAALLLISIGLVVMYGSRRRVLD